MSSCSSCSSASGCSSKGNPGGAGCMESAMARQDQIIADRLAHIRHKNHGEAFYRLIASVLPDYKERIKLLKE